LTGRELHTKKPPDYEEPLLEVRFSAIQSQQVPGIALQKMFRTEPKNVLRNQKLNDHGF